MGTPVLTFSPQTTIIAHVACTYRAIELGYGRSLTAIPSEDRPSLEKVRGIGKICMGKADRIPTIAPLYYRCPLRSRPRLVQSFGGLFYQSYGSLWPSYKPSSPSGIDGGGMDIRIHPCRYHPWQCSVDHVRWNAADGKSTPASELYDQDKC